VTTLDADERPVRPYSCVRILAVRFVVKGFLDLAEITGDDGVSHIKSQVLGVRCNLRIVQHGLRTALGVKQDLPKAVASRDRLQNPSKIWRLFCPVAHRATVLRVDLEFKVSNVPQRVRGQDVQRKEVMANIAKVITIIGSSPESFAKAADAAVQEAAKTVRDISGAQVVSMSAEVEGDHISVYRTTVNIAFGVERS